MRQGVIWTLAKSISVEQFGTSQMIQGDLAGSERSLRVYLPNKFTGDVAGLNPLGDLQL